MSIDPRVALDDLVACPGCDLLHRRAKLEPGEQARCLRCRSVLLTCKPRTVERTLALSLGGIVFLLMSLTLPFLALSRSGIESRISVLDAVRSLWASDLRWLGVLTLALIVLLPLARLVLLAWVMIGVRGQIARRPGTRPPPRHRALQRRAFRWAIRIEPWAMADVFMIGVAISLVKLGSVARLEVGLAFWALCALIVTTVFVERVLCKDTVWRHLDS